MAGNTCLLKHDPHVPACAAAIASVFARAGAPQGVFQNLPLVNEDVAAVIQHNSIRGVSFTGSERAGGVVAGLAAGAIKPVVLELGGADPCLVMADADLEAAIPVITLSRMINAGQSCIAAKRIIVEAPIYDEVVAKLTEAMAKLRLGDPSLETTDVGPIARADLREQLHRQVAATIDAGARCLLGGQIPDGPGFFYPATVLADVTTEMVAAQEETFGPVMVVMRAADEAEAIQMANDTPYGLAGSVWSRTDRAIDIAQQLETGQVAINGIVKTDPRLPSGGIKRSGIGRELGPHGIREFANAQQIWVGPKQD
jgi:succinate-semialdehyde dehydrogenase/glutarate-semialdehyde dehydrogenase